MRCPHCQADFEPDGEFLLDFFMANEGGYRAKHPPVASHPLFDIEKDFPSMTEYAAGRRFPTWEELEARRK